MIFQTVGNIENPAVLFFHAMGVTGKSSSPVAEHLKDRYYCIMPTSTVYCAGQNYISKAENADMRGAYAVSGSGGIAHEPAVDKPRRRGGKQMKTYGEEDL